MVDFVYEAWRFVANLVVNMNFWIVLDYVFIFGLPLVIAYYAIKWDTEWWEDLVRQPPWLRKVMREEERKFPRPNTAIAITCFMFVITIGAFEIYDLVTAASP